MSLQISPLSRSFGAEVLNADISGSLGKGVREEIWRALLRNKLLVFRQQALAPSDIVTFAKYFGEPDTHDSVPAYRYPGIDELRLVTNKSSGNKTSTRDRKRDV